MEAEKPFSLTSASWSCRIIGDINSIQVQKPENRGANCVNPTLSADECDVPGQTVRQENKGGDSFLPPSFHSGSNGLGEGYLY